MTEGLTARLIKQQPPVELQAKYDALSEPVKAAWQRYQQAESKVTSAWSDEQHGYKRWAGRRFSELYRTIDAEGLDFERTLGTLSAYQMYS